MKTARREKSLTVQTLQPLQSSTTASHVTVTDLKQQRHLVNDTVNEDASITVGQMEEGIKKVSVSCDD